MASGQPSAGSGGSLRLTASKKPRPWSPTVLGDWLLPTTPRAQKHVLLRFQVRCQPMLCLYLALYFRKSPLSNKWPTYAQYNSIHKMCVHAPLFNSALLLHEWPFDVSRCFDCETS